MKNNRLARGRFGRTLRHMAWRIDEHVVRGEIDNRVRGRVAGKIWFVGHAEPVELELTGNCWRDLAGRRLEFVNPAPKPGPEGNLATRQVGAVGDITASRKVKVLDFPLEDMHLYSKTGREMPWHWGNSLYLEWFSEFNGRVVIESASYELKMVGEPAWEMTEAEEETQRRANAEAMGGFIALLSEGERGGADNGGEWDDESGAAGESKPMTEAEAEAMQARSDLLADRVRARLERAGPEADHAKILEEEIERLNREDPPPEPTPEQVARNEEWLEAFNRGAKEALENPDPEDEAERSHEHPVQELLDALMKAHVKLAAWLNSRAWPPELDFCAITIVRLKKAREYLDDAVRAMESCQEEKLIEPARLGPMLVDVGDLASDVDELIAELRARLERGTE